MKKTYNNPTAMMEAFNEALMKPTKIAEVISSIMVLYGLPKAQANGQNVADYGRIVHDGSFSKNIPPRPFLRTIESRYGDKVASDIKNALEEIQENFEKNSIDKQKIKDIIERRIALPLQNYVKANILDGGWVANSQYTINKKGSDKPLIDTGEMLSKIIALVDEF